MSLSSLSNFAKQDSLITTGLLRQLARRNNFTISPQDEAAYLLGLRSSYDIAKEVDLLPDYIDPRLSLVPTLEASRTSRRPRQGENELMGWCHISTLRAAAPESQLLAARSVVVKDTIAVGQVPQTLGTLPRFVSKTGEYPRSTVDATVVRRLLLAGATLEGTSTCENFSTSPLSCTSAFGPVRNPWNRDFMTGGSSSGSATLVALGIARRAGEPGLNDLGPHVDMAIGGDQAGSIRLPAAHCGLYGLKPTFGLVPYTGVAGLLPMIDHVGPMASSVEDIALLLSTLAGYDGLDTRMGPESPLRENVIQYHEQLAEFVTQFRQQPQPVGQQVLRIGLIAESFQLQNMSPEVAHVVRTAAEKHFKVAGAEVSIVSIPLHLKGPAIWTAAVRNQMASHAIGGRAADMLTHDMPHLSTLWPPTQEFYEVISDCNPAVVLTVLGETLLTETLPLSAQRKAHRHVLQLRAAYDEALEKFDVLITPTAPTVAARVPIRETNSIQDPGIISYAEKILRLAAGSINNTCPFNATGHPGLSVPCGWATAEDGSCKLPVGMQIIGKRFEDLAVLKAAKVFELGGGKLGPRPA